MVTGKKAFEGKSQVSVASAILEKEQAPISYVKPMMPTALDHIVENAWQKLQMNGGKAQATWPAS